MKEGQLKSSNRSGCLMYLALIYAFPMLAALAVLPLGVVYLCFRAGEIGNGLFVLAVWKIQCKLPPKTKRFCPLVLK
ncbi:hypothetical protein ACMSEF_27015 [Bacteroides thetaiotaomicron]|uniref:hypothetical protein n=1 Tax=Bacteroides thetaiotaomicron TaxID=818 RepID=UPI0039C0FDA5